MVIALELQTKSQLLERTENPVCSARTNGLTPSPILPYGPGSSSSGPASLPPTKKRRAPLRSSLRSSLMLGSSSYPLTKKKGLFFSAEYEGEGTIINDMVQLWGACSL